MESCSRAVTKVVGQKNAMICHFQVSSAPFFPISGSRVLPATILSCASSWKVKREIICKEKNREEEEKERRLLSMWVKREKGIYNNSGNTLSMFLCFLTSTSGWIRLKPPTAASPSCHLTYVVDVAYTHSRPPSRLTLYLSITSSKLGPYLPHVSRSFKHVQNLNMF